MDRGTRLGNRLETRLTSELRTARETANVSQRRLAALLGVSQTDIWRAETGRRRVTLESLAAWASVLGLELSAGLHPFGDPIRDRGHQALIARFIAALAPTWRIARELPFPTPGDPRTWDAVIRVSAQIVGVECETRVRDVQAFTRRVHQREATGGVHAILIVLADTATNRRLLPQLLAALGESYVTPRRRLLNALRSGQPVPGSGVVLL